MEDKKITFYDYLYVIAKWKKYLIINFLIVCFTAAIISLVIPKWYKSSSAILPPTGQTGGLDFSSILSSLPVSSLGVGISPVSDEASLVMALTKSRTMMETVIEKFDLIKRYKSKNMEEAVKQLKNRVDVEITDEGTLVVTASTKTGFFASKDKDEEARLLSRDMANFVVNKIDELNKNLRNERARNKRNFIEKRYHQNMQDLKNAEEEFKAFQEKYGVISLPEQTEAIINAAAQLKAQIIAKEIEVSVLQNYVGEGQEDYRTAEIELKELKRKYTQLENGQESRNTGANSELFLPLNNMPEIGLQYVRLYRELMLQEKIMEFIVPQYEQSKIEEISDSPTIQIIDKAVKPIKRVQPKRGVMVVLAGFVSIFFFVIVVYFYVKMEYLKQYNPELFEKIKDIYIEIMPERFRKKYVN